ncbi:MAG: Glu-tRNA(Gln) amidotransferase subunit GatE [Euryarchaeota archaeon]|nr:Glu-tRNA(Gln) amidotransferase subunit GatE [Euryarchaeota archaeon]
MNNTLNLDYKKLGLKAGLEIHQQLDTKYKLFCRCPTLLRDTRESNYEFYRYLRPTQSEMGETDRAALEEAKVIRKFIYKAYPSTCLVENDEEPPRELNEEAIDITLTIARLFNMPPVDLIHTMRKIVIDGSNTTGFQRTSLVATDGYFETSQGRVGVDVLCLEEEACQRVEERKGAVVFSLDRLGIPLVEIGTAPDIVSPAHARESAEQIGMILRSTGAVKRGIGTIRQDINISIAEGARVEVKGVQELDLIETIVEYEALRQTRLLEIRDELQERDAAVGEMIDVTHIFENTGSPIIKRAIKKGCVLALCLHGFAGMVGKEIQPGRRLGSEFSDRAKKAGVGGIFHTDELPAYGITEDEVLALRTAAGAEPEDCVVIVADMHDQAVAALSEVRARAEQAMTCVPEETRKMLADGSTAYLRPLPGAARMYPETDIPPVPISGRIDKIIIPELLSSKKNRYIREYKLSEDLAQKITYSRYPGVFEDIMNSVSVDAALVVRTLTATLTELRKEGIHIEQLQNKHFLEMFRLISDATIAKEGIIDILRLLAEEPDRTVADVASSLGLIGMTEEQIESVIATVVSERSDFVHIRGEGAHGPLMGVVMRKLRGRADGNLISRILTEKIREELL